MTKEIFEQFIGSVRGAFEDFDACCAEKKQENDNIQRVQEMYGLVAAGDFAGMGAYLADDCELEIYGPKGVAMVGQWRGRQTVLDAIQGNFAVVEAQAPQILKVVAQGDIVVVMAKEHGKFKPTGKTYEFIWLQIFTFRGDKVSRIEEVFDTAVMQEAMKP